MCVLLTRQDSFVVRLAIACFAVVFATAAVPLFAWPADGVPFDEILFDASNARSAGTEGDATRMEFRGVHPQAGATGISQTSARSVERPAVRNDAVQPIPARGRSVPATQPLAADDLRAQTPPNSLERQESSVLAAPIRRAAPAAGNPAAAGENQATAPAKSAAYPAATDQPNSSAATPPAAGGPEAAADVAADAAANAANPATAIGQLKKHIKKLENSEDLAEDQKAEVIKTLSKALEWFEIAQQAAQKIREYEAETLGVPGALAQAKAMLNQPAQKVEVHFPAEASLLDLEQMLDEAEQDFEQRRGALADMRRQIRERTERKAQLGKRVEEATARLQDAEKQQKIAAADTASSELVAARRHELRGTPEMAARFQLQLCQAETLRHKAVIELLPVQRDLAQRAVAHSEKTAAAWKKLVANFRKYEVERQAQAARAGIERAHPSLRPLAERIAQLAENRLEMVTQIDSATNELTAIRAALSDVEETFKDMQEKVDGAGLSVPIGLLLRKHRKQLPDVERYRQRLVAIEAEMPKLQLVALQLEDERAEMADLEAYTKTLLGSPQVASATGGAVAPGAVQDYLHTKRDYLDDVLNDHDTYQDKLGEIDISARKLIEKTKEFANYVDGHVLWIRSTERLATADFRKAARGLAVMCHPQQLRDLGVTAWANLRKRSAVTLGVVICLTCLLIVGGRLRSWLLDTGRRVQVNETVQLTPTLEALALTLLISAVWPTLICLIGWLLATTTGESDLVRAVARACNVTAVLFLAVEVVRQVARRGGLAERHFNWPASATAALRNNLRLLMFLGLPTVFAVVIAETYQDGQWADSLGRLAFIFGMLGLAWILHRVAKRCRTWVRGLNFRDDSPARWEWLWRPILVGTPLALALLAGMGYYYSAEQLAVRMKITFWVLLVVLLVYALVSHGLAAVARKIGKRIADQQAEAEANAERDAITESAEEAPPVVTEEPFDIEKVTHQVQRLLRGAAAVACLVAAYFIWVEVLPAIQFLDRVELWSSTLDVAERVTDADGNETTTHKTVTAPITLNHLILALIIFQVTFVAARNLPGLLRITILDRLPIDNGGRHAVAIICGYAVTVVGCMFGLRIIGITWSSLQWLVAAMTVGLGFGLQEIFANFVSGLIILFERPIRLGDFVTVGETTGHVTRMQIRATTITDLDHRELVVPNKSFITGELINWSLTNPVSRMVVPVGIAYGSDTALAKRELLAVAEANPLVLDEPAPQAVFVGFGDSTLNFELRIFIPSRDVYAQTLHEVNTAIDTAFRKASLEIAFPQQDIHVRSIEAVLPLAGSPNQPAASGPQVLRDAA